MKLSCKYSLIFTVLAITFITLLSLAVQVQSVGTGCATNSCWWHNLEGGPCRTKITGQVGRSELKRVYKCILGKQKHFCCDPDCGYKECGKTCQTLGLNGSWENAMPPQQCTIPGVDPISALQHFCCG